MSLLDLGTQGERTLLSVRLASSSGLHVSPVRGHGNWEWVRSERVPLEEGPRGSVNINVGDFSMVNLSMVKMRGHLSLILTDSRIIEHLCRGQDEVTVRLRLLIFNYSLRE